MTIPTIKQVRAFTVRGGGADYHDQGSGHWIDDHIASPMARYPEYRQSRQAFGINLLGTLVVELEASDGTTGFAVTTGGVIGAFIVEKHLARFLEGRRATDIEKIWDQMYFATLYYGRKGVAVFGMYTLHGSLENHSPINRVRLSCDVRWQPAGLPVDERYFGADPGGTTGAGYGELVGAKPLTQEWHVR